MSQLVTFYHYTNAKNAEGIISSGVIHETMDGGRDAMLGRGVYGTKVPVRAGKGQIARNNWTSGWKSRLARGDVDVVFQITMPRNELDASTVPPNRQIYIHRGPIVLNNYEWQMLEV